MRRVILIGLLSLYLCLLTGCSRVLVYSDILTDNPRHPLIDPNIGPVKMKISGKHMPTKMHTKPIIELSEPCRVKYCPCYVDSSPRILVIGQIPKGREYHVTIDSGSCMSMIISDRIVLENNLPIYPIEHNQIGGICYLPFLKLGKAIIHNIPGIYRKQQWESQLFGIPIDREKFIIVGLRLMEKFRYILLDGIRKEMELSAKQSFAPIQPSHWSYYPCAIEKDAYNNDRLMVDIPIEGIELHIAFDTDLGENLMVTPEVWAKLSKRIKVENKKTIKWSGYEGIEIDCQEITITKLNIDNTTIKDAQVLVLPEHDTYLTNILGMKCFKNTIVVLDFERNLMWVKNSATD